MAMDASSQEVRRMVVRQGMILALTGVIIGVAAALTSLLYGVTPRDPMAMASVGVLLTGVALAATLPSSAARIKGRSGNLASI
jgi:putative ABC transport system permease protein